MLADPDNPEKKAAYEALNASFMQLLRSPLQHDMEQSDVEALEAKWETDTKAVARRTLFELGEPVGRALSAALADPQNKEKQEAYDRVNDPFVRFMQSELRASVSQEDVETLSAQWNEPKPSEPVATRGPD